MLVPFLVHEGEPSILLTQRAAHLPEFAGQVCFPGGAHEPGRDADLAATACRETEEELGIPASRIEVFRELDWFATGLGHRVKPFAANLRGPLALRPNPEEVARALFLPLSVLRQDPFRERGRFRDAAGVEHLVHAFDWDGAEVWGLTARILREVMGWAPGA